ncbi:MAG: copper chaperone PCu(A)C [Roseiarcus sp.]|jgi:copper(I)-binding protein
MNRFHAVCLALALGLSAAPAFAQETKTGDLTIEKPWARATPKGAEVGVGYLEIRNNGASPDRLTGGSADFAAVEIHEMSMAGGVMKMRELKDGLEIPAHGSVKLAPNGYHVMFTGLKRPLVEGESVRATLTFEHAGAVAVDFAVQGVGAAGPGGAAKGEDMKGMKM